MSRIVIEQLSKHFTGPQNEVIRAVDALSLTVAKGEFLALVGPSGCGKTTTLRLISGLEEPSGGTIAIDGRPMNGVAPKRRDIAMVFQSPALYPHMTVRENITFGLRLRKCPRTELEQRLREAADILNLQDCLERRPAELSGGQCQRVAVGRAIVRRPGVFLFDEPLSNLDPPMRSQLRGELARLHKRLGATTIYVTHDQGEAMMLGDRVAVMNRGTLQQVAAPSALYARPENLFVAGFIGSPRMNFFEGALRCASDEMFFLEKSPAEEAGQQLARVRLSQPLRENLEAYIDKDVILGIRPENLRCAEAQSEVVPGILMHGVIEFIEPSGGQVYLHVRRRQQTWVAIAGAADRVQVGQTVALTADLRQAHCFEPGTGKAI